VPSNGTYTVEIHDSLYRGREDFVYRMTIGELPFVTGIFPLGGKAGEKTSIALTGWNLPEKSLERENAEAGITSLNGNFSTPFHLPWTRLPECLEQEPNDSPETAQAVTLPVIINGRIDHPGDWDVFRFEGKTGDPVVADVDARRLDSPLDSVIKLTDAAGKQLAFNDDYEDKGSGLNTHHADSYFSTVLPTNGTYYLWLGDAQHKGRPGIQLPSAPQSAAARFRAAGCAVQPQRPRRRERSAHRLCVAQGRVHQPDHPGFGQRARRVQVDRRLHSGRPEQGASHIDRSSDRTS
jgi:hypothetical protein